MNPELLRTCQLGDVEKLRKLMETRSHDHEFFLSQENEEKKNILHILSSQHGKQACAEEAIKTLPNQVVRQLACQADIHGNNPLHVAISLDLAKLIVDAYMSCDGGKDPSYPPWKVKNSDHKLPVQVAVAKGRDEVAEFLLSVDPDFLRNDDNAGSLLLISVTNSHERTGVRLLEQHPEELFKGQDPSHKMKILKHAIEKDFVDIIKKILKIDASISYDLRNVDDRKNPLHIALEYERHQIARVLVDEFNEYLKRQVEEHVPATTNIQPPWRQTNVDNKTPLYLALSYKLTDFAKYLLSSDFAFLSCLADHSGQDSPNSLVKELEDSKEFRDVYLDTFLQFIRDNRGEATKKLIKQHPELVRFKDNSRRTILQHASNENDVDTMIFILRAVNILDNELVPLLIEVDDAGKHQTTALHKVRQQSREKYQELLAIPAIKLLKNKTDAFGRTPLIKAIEESDWDQTNTLLDTKGVNVIGIKSENGKTAAALLKDKSKESPEWEKLYKKASKLQPSPYIPPEADLTKIGKTLSFVAALLATLTFAAAFTVPGGFDQNNGYILLGQKPSFIIFILSDTYAMCCSMIALYALITASIKDAASECERALKLINFSVDILHHSFYGTLGAFMTGVYTMLSSKTLWVTIIVLVMCSTIMISAYMIISFELVDSFVDTCLSGRKRFFDAITKPKCKCKVRKQEGVPPV